MGSYCSRAWNCLNYKDKEVSAFMRVTAARSPLAIVATLFSAAALTILAELLDDDCDGRVNLGFFTLNISSVLSAGQVIENIANALLIPLFGAIADSTPNRKFLLILTSAIYVSCVGLGGITLLFSPSLTIIWLFFLSGTIASVFYELAFFLLWSYLPELAKSEVESTKLVTKHYGLLYGIMLGTAVVLSGIALAFSDLFENELPLTTIGQLLFVVWFCYFGIPGLYNLPKRRQTIERSSTMQALHKMGKSFVFMYRHYPNLFKFYLSWMFFISGVNSISILQVAYVIEEFDFQTFNITVLGALLLIFATVGTALAKVLPKHFRLKSILISLVLSYGIGMLVFPFLLRGEETEPSNITDETAAGCLIEEVGSREPNSVAAVLVYFFAALNGIGNGLIFPINQSIFALMVPGGEEATYFGFKSFFAKLLTWAPALLFTTINEAFDNLQLAFMSIALFFLLSLPLLFAIDVRKAQDEIKHTLHLREGRQSDGTDKDDIVNKI